MIYERDETVRHNLRSTLIGYQERCGEQFSLLSCTGKLDEAERCLRAEGGVTMVVIGVALRQAEIAAKLERICAECNRDNYVLYWLHDAGDLPGLAVCCLHPVGFVVPPPQEEQVERILRWVCADYRALAEPSESAFLTLQCGGKVCRVPTAQILYVEALDKKLNIWTHRQCLSVYDKLADMEQRLGERFVRCHRSYLVNYSWIESVDYAGMEVALPGDVRLPISRSGKDALKQRVAKEANEA